MNKIFVYVLLIASSSWMHPMSDDPERKERAAVIDGLDILKGEAEYPLNSVYVTKLNWGSFTFPPIKARFTCAAFHPDGTTLAYGYYGKHKQAAQNPPCFYDLPRGYESAQPIPLKGVITSMTFSPNGHLFAFGNKIHNEESSLTIYDSLERDSVPYSWTMRKSQCASPFLCMQFSPDNATLALASHDGAVRLWDVATNKCIHTFREESIEPTHAVAYTDNDQVCYNDTRGCIILSDTRSPSTTQIVQVHSDIVRTISANLTRKLLVSGFYDGSVRFADLRKFDKDLVRAKVLHNNSPVMSIAMHPHYAECIAGHRNGKVYLYDTTGNYVFIEPDHHKARVTAVTLSATRDYWAASVSYDGQLKL